MLLWIVLSIGTFATLAVLLINAEPETHPPVFAPVEPMDREINTSASLLLEWDAEQTITLPSVEGTVTQVHIHPGESLSNGQMIVSIDGIGRVAFFSDRGFYRLIDGASTGEDVALLNTMLASFGLPYSDGDKFTSLTSAGVKQLNKNMNAPLSAIFDPATIVIVPFTTTSIEIGDILAQVGGHVSPNATLISTAPRLIGATIIQPSSGFETDDNGEQTPSSSSAIELPQGSRLTVANHEVPVEEDDRTRVSNQGLGLLEAVAAQDATSVAAYLLHPSRGDERTVPAAAVVSDAAGGQCVLVKSGAESLRSVHVEAIASSAGRVTLRGAVAVGEQVLISSVESGRECS